MSSISSRREFLRFLAGSPVLAAGVSELAFASAQAADDTSASTLIDKASDALNVFDFEAKAQATPPPAHWGYLAGGVEDDLTLQANRAAFEQYHVRPRRLINVSQVDASTNLFGEK